MVRPNGDPIGTVFADQRSMYCSGPAQARHTFSMKVSGVSLMTDDLESPSRVCVCPSL